MIDTIENSNCELKAFHVTEENIIEIDKLIPKDLLTVKGTTLVHQVVWTKSDKDNLGFRFLSCIDCMSITKCLHYGLSNSTMVNYPEDALEEDLNMEISDLDNLYKTNNCIVVIYNKKWYPGIILNIGENKKISVKFINRNAKKFIWPSKDDIQEVVPEQILCKILTLHEYQNKINRKTEYKISDEEYYEVSKLAKNCLIY